MQHASYEIYPTFSLKRLFVFGGTYGNLQATYAVLNEAQNRGFSPEEMLCTGDLVAYCADSQETSECIRNLGCHIIMGNCEESLSNGSNDCGCGFEEGSACDLLSAQWFGYCDTNISDETKEWMGSLPRHLMFDIAGHKLLACHGSPDAINEFVFPSNTDRIHEVFGDNKTIDCVIAGHSGLPFVEQIAGKTWINSGAAGMPANDGTPDTWFATIELSDNGELVFETHRLPYDYNGAAAAMKDTGLANGYMECIKSGLWPSLDVLPAEERTRTGEALLPVRMVSTIS